MKFKKHKEIDILFWGIDSFRKTLKTLITLENQKEEHNILFTRFLLSFSSNSIEQINKDIDKITKESKGSEKK